MKVFQICCLAAIVLMVIPCVLPSLQAQEEREKEMLRAAIFVQNRAGKEFNDKIDVLNDMITARLTNEGFSIIDKQDVVERFQESSHELTVKEVESGDITIKELAELQKTFKKLQEGQESGIEDALKDASALRLAQMIRADYMIFATLTTIGHKTKTFSGKNTAYGVSGSVTDVTMRITVKVMEADQGGTIYGDTVAVSERVPATEHLQVETSDIINNLLDEGALQIAQNISNKVESIRTAKVKHTGSVPFTIVTNLPGGLDGAVVELDGAVIGSTGSQPNQFTASPGIHTMRIMRDWCTPWERVVNIYADQKISVALQLSPDGTARWKDIENFKAEMAKKAAETDKIAAEAEATRLVAEGEKAKREASFERIDTSKVERLSVGDQGTKANIDVEIEENAK